MSTTHRPSSANSPWRAFAVACTLVVGVVVAAPAARADAFAPITTIAQASPDSNASQNTRSSGRGMRSLVKLGVGAVVGVCLLGAWIVKKSKKSDVAQA